MNTTDKGKVCRIYKEHQQINKKKINNPMGNEKDSKEVIYRNKNIKTV